MLAEVYSITVAVLASIIVIPLRLQLAHPRLNGTDGAAHLHSDRWRFHSRSQQLAQHIVVCKRPRAPPWTWTRHLPFAFSPSSPVICNTSCNASGLVMASGCRPIHL